MQNLWSDKEANNYNDDRFYVDNFSLNEIDYCKSKVNPKNSFAAIFSLKESIIKADNSLKTTPFNELEIKHNIEGRPIYDGFFLSNSHSNGNVVSIAIKNDLHTYHEINNTKINRLLGKFFSKKEVLFVGIFSIIISISISFFLQGR